MSGAIRKFIPLHPGGTGCHSPVEYVLLDQFMKEKGTKYTHKKHVSWVHPSPALFHHLVGLYVGRCAIGTWVEEIQ